MSASLQFSPGSGYGYSNTGYSLLAMIIKKVSGQSYETFLRKELLIPSGLNHTGYILPNWNRNQMAMGYRKGDLWGEVYKRGWIEDGPNWHLRGNGGMHKWLTTVKGHGVKKKMWQSAGQLVMYRRTMDTLNTDTVDWYISTTDGER
jgi:CubicO group peptidase (beta-lactamase class C family)